MRNLYLLAIMGLFSSLAFNVDAQERQYQDWGNIARYAKANSELPARKKGEARVIFLGNSITDNWASMRPEFFKKYGFLGRGIGGQVTPQFLVRFREDVVNLNPTAVIINGGTNDIAENQNKYDEDFTFGCIQSMAEIARANDIKVYISSVTPAAAYPWRPAITDVSQKVVSLNNRLQQYAKDNKFTYIDYYSAMCDSEHNNGMKLGLSSDGIHPTNAGYEIMEEIVLKALNVKK